MGKRREGSQLQHCPLPVPSGAGRGIPKEGGGREWCSLLLSPSSWLHAGQPWGLPQPAGAQRAAGGDGAVRSAGHAALLLLAEVTKSSCAGWPGGVEC